MTQTLRWTSADLALMPDDGKRYEIIEGELYVSRQPDPGHQAFCAEITWALVDWNHRMRGGTVMVAPGLVFADDDDAAPDVAWMSKERYGRALGQDRHLHAAPELAVEVLSPGSHNEQRDREVKLKLYSRRGVHEYWIVNWQARSIEVYRREDAALHLVATLFEADTLESPLLPGFRCPLERLFEGIPQE